MCEFVNILVLLFLIYCSVIDIKYRELPVCLLLGFSVCLMAYCLFLGEVRSIEWAGGALIGVLFLFISKCTEEALGYADSWMILLLGIFGGVWSILYMVSIAFFLCGIAAVLLVWKTKNRGKASLPFFPFLAVSYLGVMIL